MGGHPVAVALERLQDRDIIRAGVDEPRGRDGIVEAEVRRRRGVVEGGVEGGVEVAVVVDRGGRVVAGVAVPPAAGEMLVVVGFGGVVVPSEVLQALRVTMPATRTLLARFPTSAR